MFPVSTLNDMTNSRFRDVKVRSDGTMGHTLRGKYTDFSHLIFGELGITTHGTKHDDIVLAALANHIVYVVRLCAEKQVIGIDTRRVVALVKDEQAIGDGAKVEFPRQAMNRNLLAFSRTASQLESSIPVWTQVSRPQPTLVKCAAFHITPESICNRFGLGHKKCLLLTGVRALVEGARRLIEGIDNYIRLSSDNQPYSTLDNYKYSTNERITQVIQVQ